jgi:hypothetical protein
MEAWEAPINRKRMGQHRGSNRMALPLTASVPPTCSLQTKIERFRRWLETMGIEYGEDR